MLKVLLVLGTLVSSILALTEEQIALMNSLHAECVSQSKVAEDVVSAAKNGNIGDDNNLKCYMKCILDELGVIDDDEKIDVDGVVAMLPEEMQEFAPAVLKKCGTQSGADLCDAIFNTFKCYYETDKRVFFLP
ncbi:general odorant-binding protein 56d-like [Diorhabda carinulata]|uniref:general odorant-binding protein 56d-like n=1 Tax=Diorhabda carinulata TaxID=1163345 RepID=UPI0025A245AD|nr:general odorant-binding protein 56d-like [Diorhabda carinulata]